MVAIKLSVKNRSRLMGGEGGWGRKKKHYGCRICEGF